MAGPWRILAILYIFLRDVFMYFAKKDDKGVARITLSLFIRKTVAFPFWKDITWDDYSEK